MSPIVAFFFLLNFLSPGTLRGQNDAGRPDPPAHLDRSVGEAGDRYLRAMLAGDASAIAGMYGEDGVLMPAGKPLMRGRAAIAAYYRECFTGPVKITQFRFAHFESPVIGDTAYDVGTYQQTLTLPNGGTVSNSGKYSVILKRAGGEWKIAYLIYDSDSPSAH
jgi:uncharacterized protein (TIGR02246 family)